jgi:hypothetical protein
MTDYQQQVKDWMALHPCYIGPDGLCTKKTYYCPCGRYDAWYADKPKIPKQIRPGDLGLKG